MKQKLGQNAHLDELRKAQSFILILISFSPIFSLCFSRNNKACYIVWNKSNVGFIISPSNLKMIIKEESEIRIY